MSDLVNLANHHILSVISQSNVLATLTKTLLARPFYPTNIENETSFIMRTATSKVSKSCLSIKKIHAYRDDHASNYHLAKHRFPLSFSAPIFLSEAQSCS